MIHAKNAITECTTLPMLEKITRGATEDVTWYGRRVIKIPRCSGHIYIDALAHRIDDLQYLPSAIEGDVYQTAKIFARVDELYENNKKRTDGLLLRNPIAYILCQIYEFYKSLYMLFYHNICLDYESAWLEESSSNAEDLIDKKKEITTAIRV